MLTLKKSERLHSKKIIDSLFTEGSSFLIHPYKVFWMKTDFEGVDPAQTVFVVSKRIHKTAVSRNLIKRRTKEAFRTLKLDLYNKLNDNDIKLCIALSYISKDIYKSDIMKDKLNKCLEKLMKNLNI